MTTPREQEVEEIGALTEQLRVSFAVAHGKAELPDAGQRFFNATLFRLRDLALQPPAGTAALLGDAQALLSSVQTELHCIAKAGPLSSNSDTWERCDALSVQCSTMITRFAALSGALQPPVVPVSPETVVCKACEGIDDGGAACKYCGGSGTCAPILNDLGAALADVAIHSGDAPLEKNLAHRIQRFAQADDAAMRIVALVRSLLSGAAPSEKGCEWTFDEDGFYQTGCGKAWAFNAGDMKSNGLKYCPYCGHLSRETEAGT